MIKQLTAMLFFSTSVQASWVQSTCSNADQTIEFHFGYGANGLAITVAIDTEDGPSTKTEVIYEDKFDIILGEPIKLGSENKFTCKQGINAYVAAESIVTTAHSLVITPKDGNMFPSETVGLENGSLKTMVICEERSSGQYPCYDEML